MKDAVMLPELFRNAGYRTADFGKIFHNGPDHEDSRSWEVMITGSGSRVPPPADIIDGHIMPKPRNHTMQWARLNTPEDRLIDWVTAQRAADFLRRSARDKTPFFLGAGFYVPHSPYAAPSKYFDLYDPAKIPPPRAPEESVASLPPAAWYERADQTPPTEAEAARYRAAYYACVSFLDAQVGRLMEALDEADLWRNTAVVFLSDNGYHLGEHRMWHKMTLFEESTRIPLLIRAPGMAEGKRCTGLVELIDLYPTLAGLCGLKPPAKLDGSSLLPQLMDPSRPARSAVFSSVNRHEDRSRMTSAFSFFGHSVRTQGWRYTEWDRGAKGTELYDERNDPHELRNLASDPKYARVRRNLSRLLAPHAFRAGDIPAAGA
jgi:iduronate 2-sulfatase